jgi:hypothetical protein
MGCDIHLYLEHAYLRDVQEDPWWSCLIANAGSRDYHLFGIMAGVRSGGCIFPPRGVPEGKLSYEVDGALYTRIDEDLGKEGHEGYCTLEVAKQWENYGSAIVYDGDKPVKVEGPDYHTHSWLTRNEFAECLAQYTLTSDWGPYDVEYDVILAAMTAFEERGQQTRLVFWFDN